MSKGFIALYVVGMAWVMPLVMFRMNGIPTVINRKLCMQTKAGAESLPARGEGVGMDSSP